VENRDYAITAQGDIVRLALQAQPFCGADAVLLEANGADGINGTALEVVGAWWEEAIKGPA
jgi:hypothetical protein